MDPTLVNENKVRPEDLMAYDGIPITQKEIEAVGRIYNNLTLWRSYRNGFARHFQNHSFDEYLSLSRELFWNSLTTQSDDLKALGLNLTIPFARKEVMDFLGKLVSLNVKPKMTGDSLDSLGMRVLNGMYKKWAFHNNEKVETFWELLYGIMNGTVCSYIGFNNTQLQRRYLDSYDEKTGDYKLRKEWKKPWNDVVKTVVPIEDIYLPKIYERNIQKQGRLIWRTQMDEQEFRSEYGKYSKSKYVFTGSRIAEDSLFFRLLGGTGTTTALKIEVIRYYDWIADEYIICAGGIILNSLGKGKEIEIAPMPFDHKMAPFTWGILNPLDEKFAYGLSIPFQVKDPHKILNTAFSMMIERELRAVDPVIITSDLEAPEFIYGQHKIVGVNDINAYKEFKLEEPSNQFFTMINSLQGNMSAQAQGGNTTAVPSRQPRSAREVMDNSALMQQNMTNAVMMYYDILRQRTLLVVKTALQFYGIDKYEKSDKGAIRTILVNDVPLSLGGMGDMKIRIVKEKKPDMELFLEGIRESAMNGKKVEIVQVPLDFINNVEFEVNDIILEPANQNEIEKQAYVEQIVQPMLTSYIPAGVASIEKTFLRHMEKFGESASDFASDQTLQNMAGNKTNPNPQVPNGQSGAGPVGGALSQSLVGTKYGMQQSGPLPLNQ